MTQARAKALASLTAAAALAVAAVAHAGAIAPKDVTYDYGAVDQPLTDAAGDPDRGRTIMTTRSKGNCIACHAATSLQDAQWHGEVGPPLDGAADRWTEAELRGIVADAKKMFPESVMPSFYKTGPYVRVGDAFTGDAHPNPDDVEPLLSAQEIEDVVAFLKTLKEE